MANFIAWVLIIVMSCWIIGSVISIIKTVINRKKGRSDADKNHDRKEEQKDEDPK